jgi:hypothetical protein
MIAKEEIVIRKIIGIISLFSLLTMDFQTATPQEITKSEKVIISE